tara:strand:- start:2849 stop:3823 length:975 start_codon:yes stop_codon:yes gene_type:complete
MSKYTFGQKSEFNKAPSDKGIQIGTVKFVGKVGVDTTNEQQRTADERFNSDPHVIRVRVEGASWDKNKNDAELTNCYPLLPAHLNVVPKVGEAVFIFTFDDDTKFADRFYMGPIISSPLTLQKDTIDKTALSSLSISPLLPNVDVDTITDAKGVFPAVSDIALQGRRNADVILKENQALIRAGQHDLNDNKIFNKTNPAYIQLRFNAPIKKGENNKPAETGSVTNIVANKINLLTHKGGAPRFVLADNEYNITDEELLNILNTAHPIAFGDTLLVYLKKLELALANHVHRFPGLKWTAVDGEDYIKQYLEFPTETILSKNIMAN